MKKQLLFALALLGAFTAAKAQSPDTARLMVHYKFTYIDDTTDRAHPHTENMVLYVGKSAGAYWSYDMIEANEQFKKAWAIAVASSPDGQPRINRMNRGSQTQYFQYPNQQKLLIKDNLMVNSYLVENQLPAIDWKISSDTATFGGLHCQKATCHFKGRDYIAWFSPDLPVRVGPWKLNGLPGVIVDAHDVKNEVVFQFDGIEKTAYKPTEPVGGANVATKDLPPILRDLDYDPNIIAPPSGTIKTTQPEFDKLKAAMKKDPQAFADAMMAANSADPNAPKMDHIMIGKRPGPGGSGGHTLNNPIELPEK